MASKHHNNHNLPVIVEKEEVVLVTPSKQTPSHVLSFSSIDNDLVLELICQTLYVYQQNPGNHSIDPVPLIKDAISKVLVPYYPLAGKLKRDIKDGRLYLTCNGEGVPFLEATVDRDLSSLDYLEGIDPKVARLFILDIESHSEFGYHPLMFQITKFSCGGFTIGMGLSHSVCDGFGAAQFFTAMAELASGRLEPSVTPVWERERLLVRKYTNDRFITTQTQQESTIMADGIAITVNPPSTTTKVQDEGLLLPFKFKLDGLAKSPYLPTNEIVHECFNVKSESIKRLKEELMKENGSCIEPTTTFTTIEALGAYIWRARLRALKLNGDGKTFFFLATGIRNRLKPPLPKGYYGNAFVSATSVLTGEALNEGKLCDTAKVIKESKRIASSEKYILSELESREKLVELKMKVEGANGATMVLTDWRQLGLLEQVDFGWKGAVNIVPVPWKMFGYIDLCFFVPPCNLDHEMKGGVRVLVCLPKQAMPKFKQEMDALSYLGDI